MITKIGLQNVRLFRGKYYDFPLRSISIFCGTNSCGKSTVLKTMLLLRQSQGINETYGTRPGTLRFSGAQVDLGNYVSFVSNGNPGNPIRISLDVDEMMPTKYVKALARSNSVDLKLTKSFTPYTMSSDFVFKAFKSTTDSDEAGRIHAVVPQAALQSAAFQISVNDSELASWRVSAKFPKQGKTIPYRINIPKTEVFEWDRDLNEIATQTAPEETALNLRTVLQGLLPQFALNADSSNLQEASRRLNLPIHMSGSLSQFNRNLSRVNYLGPLRSAAKRYYLTNFDISPDLDPRGDFLPYILGGIIEEPTVTNVPPNGKNGIEQKLIAALDSWLYYLKTGTGFNRRSKRQELDISTAKGALVEINIKGPTGTRAFSIADSGFGYSQVLPILVRGLLAPPGSTLVIEQPELHLNPALQVRLADFFVALARSGKQIILETHSEHIVNAIRVRTAYEDDNFLADNSVIYFLDVEKGFPDIRQLNIQPDGIMPEWPYKFFGEAAQLTGKLLRAQRLHRPQQ